MPAAATSHTNPLQPLAAAFLDRELLRPAKRQVAPAAAAGPRRIARGVVGVGGDEMIDRRSMSKLTRTLAYWFMPKSYFNSISILLPLLKEAAQVSLYSSYQIIFKMSSSGIAVGIKEKRGYPVTKVVKAARPSHAKAVSVLIAHFLLRFSVYFFECMALDSNFVFHSFITFFINDPVTASLQEN